MAELEGQGRAAGQVRGPLLRKRRGRDENLQLLPRQRVRVEFHRFSQMRAYGFACCHRRAVRGVTQGFICSTVSPRP